MLTVKKLHDDLETWIRIGIGDDIVNMPEQRKEYQHLVKECSEVKLGTSSGLIPLPVDRVPSRALRMLENELAKPWYLQRTFWVLLKMKLTRAIKHVFSRKIA